jgi:hypothetical protein
MLEKGIINQLNTQQHGKEVDTVLEKKKERPQTPRRCLESW